MPRKSHKTFVVQRICAPRRSCAPPALPLRAHPAQKNIVRGPTVAKTPRSVTPAIRVTLIALALKACRQPKAWQDAVSGLTATLFTLVLELIRRLELPMRRRNQVALLLL
eukprot:GEMP01089468.1.p3 GENE.GEMP01089468.1~~GEMP01089468.1.p3  ORF type:complete len:110 (+),score=22.32 GEMP01089468.1:498-827(+)